MSGPNARSAPKGWEAVVADLAERHADELERRVGELRRLASQLRAWRLDGCTAVKNALS